MSGYIHTEEAIAKFNKRILNLNNHPMFGNTHSPESKILISKVGK